MASTFPRYKNDTNPEFVFDFSKNIAKYNTVYVLVPHDKGAKFKENIHGLKVFRFPYFIPKYETLAYRGGMINKFKESFIAKLQLPIYLFVFFIYSVYLVIVHRIDIIHAHWLFPQGFIAVLVKLLTGKKVVITTHGGDIGILNNKIAEKILGKAILYADKVTYVSKTNLSIAENSVGNIVHKNSAILPMGIYFPKNIESTEHDNIRLLFIGRLVKIKGLNILLRSLSIAIKTNPTLHLTVLGDGPEKNTLIELSKKLGISKQVAFKGYISGINKNKYISDSDVVVIPSIIEQNGYQEGLPVVALEALSYGKLLIATKTGGLVELINKENGILTEPGDIKSLADILSSLNTTINPKSFSEKARETAKQYSWHKITERFLQLIKDIYKNE